MLSPTDAPLNKACNRTSSCVMIMDACAKVISFHGKGTKGSDKLVGHGQGNKTVLVVLDIGAACQFGWNFTGINFAVHELHRLAAMASCNRKLSLLHKWQPTTTNNTRDRGGVYLSAVQNIDTDTNRFSKLDW